jgi:structural protein
MERIQLRRDLAAKWAEINPILMEGEVGFEIDTKLRKIGDGVTAWNNLDYLAAENIV